MDSHEKMDMLSDADNIMRFVGKNMAEERLSLYGIGCFL